MKSSTIENDADLPLPVPIGAALPARPSSMAMLGEKLTELADALAWREHHSDLRTTDLPALRLARKTLPAIMKQFTAMDRRANVDHVALAAAELIRTMPMAGSVDPEPLGRFVAEELAAEKVSVFELQQAVRELRRTAEFFSLPKLLDEIKRARQIAGRYRRALAVDIDAEIAAAEEAARRKEQEHKSKLGEIRGALDALKADGKLRFPLFTLAGVRGYLGGYLDRRLLIEAMTADERDSQWLALPYGLRWTYNMPEWQPPDDPDDEREDAA